MDVWYRIELELRKYYPHLEGQATALKNLFSDIESEPDAKGELFLSMLEDHDFKD
jgi:hypothetical protein